MAKRTIQVTHSISVDTRKQEKELTIRLPRNTVRLAQLAIITKGMGRPILSNAAYHGKAAGSKNDKSDPTLDGNFIVGLQRTETEGTRLVIKISTAAGEKIYIAHPERWGIADFVIEDAKGIFQGGFMPPVKKSVTDPETNATEDYYLYESQETDLDATIYVY